MQEEMAAFKKQVRNEVERPIKNQVKPGKKEFVCAGKYKVSIANIRGSSDENNPYGTFTVQVRQYNDNDKAPEVLEEFAQCDLNPNSDFNLRAEVWRIITDLDSLKKKCVEDFNRKLKLPEDKKPLRKDVFKHSHDVSESKFTIE